MRRRGLFAVALLAALAFAPAPAKAETIRDLFDQANALYWKGDHAGARDIYHRVVEDYRIDNAEVYLNLANAYSQLDQLGSAVLYYKRALRCAPSASRKAVLSPRPSSTCRSTKYTAAFPLVIFFLPRSPALFGSIVTITRGA